MRLHLDTSFLVDWERRESSIQSFVREILQGEHQVSIDPVGHTEFLSSQTITSRMTLIVDTVLRIGSWIPITREASEIATMWLSRMDETQRRAHFADALIASAAVSAEATLLSRDGPQTKLFNISTLYYTI